MSEIIIEVPRGRKCCYCEKKTKRGLVVWPSITYVKGAMKSFQLNQYLKVKQQRKGLTSDRLLALAGESVHKNGLNLTEDDEGESVTKPVSAARSGGTPDDLR